MYKDIEALYIASLLRSKERWEKQARKALRDGTSFDAGIAIQRAQEIDAECRRRMAILRKQAEEPEE